MFVELYSNSDSENGLRLRPKHRLLIHLPTVILQSGPLAAMNCMRNELKKFIFQKMLACCLQCLKYLQNVALQTSATDSFH
jgi:hypothetical protein